MPVSARLYRDPRSTHRYTLGLDATVRDPLFAPIDVVVKDLSTTGFRVVADRELPVAAEIGLGLAGIGARSARIVWRGDGGYGCEFLQPITIAELRAALTADQAAVVVPFAEGAPSAPRPSQERPLTRRLTIRSRVATIVALAAALWGLVIAISMWMLAAAGVR